MSAEKRGEEGIDELVGLEKRTDLAKFLQIFTFLAKQVKIKSKKIQFEVLINCFTLTGSEMHKLKVKNISPAIHETVHLLMS